MDVLIYLEQKSWCIDPCQAWLWSSRCSLAQFWCHLQLMDIQVYVRMPYCELSTRSLMSFCSLPVSLSLLNGCRPYTIWYNVHPSAQTSSFLPLVFSPWIKYAYFWNTRVDEKADCPSHSSPRCRFRHRQAWWYGRSLQSLCCPESRLASSQVWCRGGSRSRHCALH